MNRFGLIGKHIDYSFSKKLHSEIAKLFNFRIQYELIDCEHELDVIDTLNSLRRQVYNGLNVTIPYKEFVMGYCDELTDAAKTIGAVNTLYLKEGKIVGDNTDYIGFQKLLNLYHVNPKSQVCYVLGSGGAAKAVCYALKQLGCKAVVVSRDKSKVQDKFDLVTSYQTLDILPKIDILINTTPIGTHPKTDQMPVSKQVAHKTNIVIDLIYNPAKTRLMNEACFGINGLSMLVGQALKAQSIWQDKNLDDSKETYDHLMEVLS